MKFKQHFYLYFSITIVLLFTMDFDFSFIHFFAFFLVNPDIDQYWKKIVGHRWFFTHSLIFPTIMYFGMRYMIYDEFETQFQLILYLPIIVHLFGDFYNPKKVQGFGCITLWHNVRLNRKWSYVWFFVNIIWFILVMVINI